MDSGVLMKTLALLISAAVLIQQVVAALVRAKRAYDGHDEAVSRKRPVAYLFNRTGHDPDQELASTANSAKK